MSLKSFFRDTFPYRVYKELRASYAAAIHHHPAKQMTIIGVTGTDGKTTTCHLLAHFLQASGKQTVLISTTGAKIQGKEVAGVEKMTSYDPLDLHSILHMAREEGCTHAVIESSSHGLQQYRLKHTPFQVGVLTNITEEHLDYHKSLEQYALSKQILFRYVQKQGKQGVAVLPMDDAYGRRWLKHMRFGKTISYGGSSGANMQASAIREYADHTSCTISYLNSSYEVDSPLLGRFNVQNLMAALSAGIAVGLTIEAMLAALATYKHASGRQAHLSLGGVERYIDFAHTPNGLEGMLGFLQSIKGDGRVICLFGAPGERDRKKRPQMGAVVHRLADIVILTDDDAAGESRRQIISDVLPGIPRTEGPTFAILPERRLAIRHLCSIVRPGDVVLLAGKGHEQVLVTNFGKIPWDERTVLEEERAQVQEK